MFGSKNDKDNKTTGGKLANVGAFKRFFPASANEVFLGMEAEQIVMGVKGIVTAIRQLASGQVQFLVEPKGDGTIVPEAFYTDWHMLEIVGDGIQHRVTLPDAVVEVKLGQTVKHKVNGFTGVALEKFVYINGCTSFLVLPTEEYQKQFKADKPLSGTVIDHNLLEVVGKGPTTLAKQAEAAENPAIPKTGTGGPSQRANHRLGRM